MIASFTDPVACVQAVFTDAWNISFLASEDLITAVEVEVHGVAWSTMTGGVYCIIDASGNSARRSSHRWTFDNVLSQLQTILSSFGYELVGDKDEAECIAFVYAHSDMLSVAPFTPSSRSKVPPALAILHVNMDYCSVYVSDATEQLLEQLRRNAPWLFPIISTAGMRWTNTSLQAVFAVVHNSGYKLIGATLESTLAKKYVYSSDPELNLSGTVEDLQRKLIGTQRQVVELRSDCEDLRRQLHTQEQTLGTQLHNAQAESDDLREQLRVQAGQFKRERKEAKSSEDPWQLIPAPTLQADSELLIEDSDLDLIRRQQVFDAKAEHLVQANNRLTEQVQDQAMAADTLCSELRAAHVALKFAEVGQDELPRRHQLLEVKAEDLTETNERLRSTIGERGSASEAVMVQMRIAKAELLLAERRIDRLEPEAAAAAKTVSEWPFVQISDVDTSPDQGAAAKHVRIECPGANEDSVSLEPIPNGVRVRIEGNPRATQGSSASAVFEREFHWDHRTEGCLHMVEEECSLELGVLSLVLRRTSPPRLRIGEKAPSLASPGRSPMWQAQEEESPLRCASPLPLSGRGSP